MNQLASAGKDKGVLKLKKLNLELVKRIDEMLASIDDFGEVRLVLQHGKLRYINKIESFRLDTSNQKDQSKGQSAS